MSKESEPKLSISVVYDEFASTNKSYFVVIDGWELQSSLLTHAQAHKLAKKIADALGIEVDK